jgi:hypothetical protein
MWHRTHVTDGFPCGGERPVEHILRRTEKKLQALNRIKLAVQKKTGTPRRAHVAGIHGFEAETERLSQQRFVVLHKRGQLAQDLLLFASVMPPPVLNKACPPKQLPISMPLPGARHAHLRRFCSFTSTRLTPAKQKTTVVQLDGCCCILQHVAERHHQLHMRASRRRSPEHSCCEGVRAHCAPGWNGCGSSF